MNWLKVNAKVIEEFRANRGQLSGDVGKMPMMLLTTTGNKTGRRLTSPLVFTTDGDDMIVIASKVGAPTHPAWYLNLVANPTVTVEVGAETYQAKAVITSGDERRRLYDAQVAVLPQFADYEVSAKGHGREIPVIRLIKN